MRTIKRNLIPNAPIRTAFFGKNAGVKALANDAAFSETEIFTMEQTHSATITIISPGTPNPVPSSDGIFSKYQETSLAVKTADCVPILIWHPSGVIGAIHAGRKGLERGIVEKAGIVLKQSFGANSDIHIWIGPHICTDCYQIDEKEDVHLDLLDAVYNQLHANFSPKDLNITLDSGCTCHENEAFYSYRKEGKGVQSNWSVISLVPPRK